MLKINEAEQSCKVVTQKLNNISLNIPQENKTEAINDEKIEDKPFKCYLNFEAENKEQPNSKNENIILSDILFNCIKNFNTLTEYELDGAKILFYNFLKQLNEDAIKDLNKTSLKLRCELIDNKDFKYYYLELSDGTNIYKLEVDLTTKEIDNVYKYKAIYTEKY